MASPNKIHKTMAEQGYGDGILSQFDFTEPKGAPPEPILANIDKMDRASDQGAASCHHGKAGLQQGRPAG